MKTAILSPLYSSHKFMKEGNSDTSPETKEESFEKLQARISELEKELKKQKAAADKGSKLLKLMWGDQFESDSLH